jgi:ell wall binding domain 2 (CWB2)
MTRIARFLVVLPLLASPVLSSSTANAGMSPPGASCPVFPSDNVWNADISQLPVNPHSSQWMASMNSSSTMLHPDFGSSGDPSAPYGIPYTVVNSSHAKVSVAFQYASESDAGPYPFGPDTPIEGGQNASGDRHAIMVDSSSCTLYELYDATYSSSGSTAGSGAIWSLGSDALRPAGWTSADAAGLPIFPGLLRPDEVASGSVTHAIRFTAAHTDASYLWPARHQAGTPNSSLPPMGARFRLDPNYPISQFAADTQVVLRAMQHYGLILADNGSNWFFQGSASNNWDPTMIQQLKTIPASAFVAVDESSLMISSDSAATKASSGGSGSSGGGSSGGGGSGGSGGNDSGANGSGASGGGSRSGLAVTRVAGADRDQTAIAASQAEYPGQGSARVVVLASDADFADALAGTPLSSANGGPLLLSHPSGLTPAVSSEISRVLSPGATVYILGGPHALASSIDDVLRSRGYVVDRVAGEDRFGTAVAIAGVLGYPADILEVTGSDFADGLSAGPAAAAVHGAVLLTNGASSSPATDAYLLAHPGTDYAIGGPAARADPLATPIVGADRYATATLVAQRFFAAPTVAGFASGQGFPDALSGGADIATKGGPLLLVPSSGLLPISLTTYLAATPSITSGVVYGGTLVVATDITTQL